MTHPLPSSGFAWVPMPWGRVLRSLPLQQLADHFFTTRDLSLGRPDDEDHDGWRMAADVIGVGERALWRVRQVHGTSVHVIEAGDRLPAPDGWPAADIMVTIDPCSALAIQVADCVPLLIADQRTSAVAAAHAGWRGTAAGVAIRTVDALSRNFDTRPGDLTAVIGPSIGPCCYEVGDELVDKFLCAGHDRQAVERWFSRSDTAVTKAVGGRSTLRLNLWRATCDQLEQAGVRRQNIHVAGLCTVTHRELFYSYRVYGPGTGRLAGVIRARGAAG